MADQQIIRGDSSLNVDNLPLAITDFSFQNGLIADFFHDKGIDALFLHFRQQRPLDEFEIQVPQRKNQVFA